MSEPNLFIYLFIYLFTYLFIHWIAESVADAAAAANPNGIKTLLANVFSTFSIKGQPLFSNG